MFHWRANGPLKQNLVLPSHWGQALPLPLILAISAETWDRMERESSPLNKGHLVPVSEAISNTKIWITQCIFGQHQSNSYTQILRYIIPSEGWQGWALRLIFTAVPHFQGCSLAQVLFQFSHQKRTRESAQNRFWKGQKHHFKNTFRRWL